MELQAFWNKEKTHHYEGHIHIGPTSHTHYTSCDGGARPLARGIAVHFTDKDGQSIFTTGPECFKKHTNISSLAHIPTIGFGFSDIRTGRSRSSALPKLLSGFKTATKGIEAEQEAAYANVLLRAKILPAMRFKVNQPGLTQYLEAPFPYTQRVLQKINRYIENGIRYHKKPSLEQLFRAHYVAHQIDALKEKGLNASEHEFINSIEQALKVYFGLTDSQMEALEQTAKRHHLLLQEANIRFPENQGRFDRAFRQ